MAFWDDDCALLDDGSVDEFFDVPDDVNVFWNDGESSDLFSGGNDFWELYPTVN